MSTVTGEIEAKSASGAVLINGEWYGSWKGLKTKAFNKGDTVVVDWSFDKTGKYKNIVTIGNVTGGVLAPSSSATSTTYVPKSNVGIELGHASKLAMDLMINLYKDQSKEIGGEEFYRGFITHTDKIYKIMSRLRQAKTDEKSTVAPTVTPELSIPVEEPDELDPIF